MMSGVLMFKLFASTPYSKYSKHIFMQIPNYSMQLGICYAHI